MSDKRDDFDPDDVLKGWTPERARGRSDAPLDLHDLLDAVAPPGARGASPADLTQVLDGWIPGGAEPAAAAPRRWAVDDVIDLPHVDLIDRGDVSDLGSIGSAAAAAARAAALGGTEAGDDVDFSATPVVVHRHVNPRLLAHWSPGAWTGAVKRVFDAVTEFLQTPQGPVIETYPPHLLLALWPPQNLDAPLLGRWPLRVMLSAAEADRASDELLPLMPPEARLWLTHSDVDWGLVGELVLHHDTALRPFQLKALRAFVDTEREATYTRLNGAYGQPAPGQAIAQREPG